MPAVKTRGGKTKKTRANTRGNSTRNKRSQTGLSVYGRAVLSRVRLAGGTGLAVFAGLVFFVVLISGTIGTVGDHIARMADRQITAILVGNGYRVERVTIVGRDQTRESDIAAALGPVHGMSLLSFDPHRARADIEALGWVRSASVSRLWPNHVNVSIRERTPAAVWQLRGELRLIDNEGVPIREVGAFEHPGLPLIVGTGAPEAAAPLIQRLERAPEMRRRISALVRIGARRWDLRFTNGARVYLPAAGFEAAIGDLVLLQETVNVLDRGFEYIDFRDPEATYFHCPGADKTISNVADLLEAGFTCEPVQTG